MMNSMMSFKKNIFDQISIAHTPSLLLLIGYPVYWLEMCLSKNSYGITSPLASCLFIVAFLWLLISKKESIVANLKDGSHLNRLDFFLKLFFLIGSSVCFVVLLVSWRAALFPPHLMQEYDALNYHITLP